MVKPPAKQPQWVDDFLSFHASTKIKGCKTVADNARTAFKKNYAAFAKAARDGAGGGGGDDEKPKKKKANPLATAMRAALKNDDANWWADAREQVHLVLSKAAEKDLENASGAINDIRACFQGAAGSLVTLRAAHEGDLENDEDDGEPVDDSMDDGGDDGGA